MVHVTIVGFERRCSSICLVLAISTGAIRWGGLVDGS